ncbi:MAG: LPS export ABC transporter periplasmic protein LptC [Candidatus Midichloria mitochondrii]|nr:LPS export ABC transporter periplasmic protein LptC [Candidatus Midichloria mitochondrii]
MIYNPKNFYYTDIFMSLFKKSVISSLKNLLVLISIAIVIALFFIHNNADKNDFKTAISQKNLLHTSKQGESLIIKSEIFGVDKQGQPFFIKAHRTNYDQNKIIMQDVYLRIFIYGDRETEIYAEKGFALMDKKQIYLEKKVKIDMPDGDTISASSIWIKFDKGIITSNKPVSLKSQDEQLSANGFKIVYNKKEKNLTFYGNAKANLVID